MLQDSPAISGFSVKDTASTLEFYSELLGMEITENPMGLDLKIKGSNNIFIYPKDDHQPATYTILNFPVENIDQAVDDLKSKGVEFIDYPDMTDDKSIARGIVINRGPDIAWFKDPSGNILSVLQNA